MTALVVHGTLHVLHVVLSPLIDGVLALATACWEVGEPLLEGQSKYVHINVVAELLGHDEEVVSEDECGEEVNDIGTTSRQRNRCLVQEYHKGEYWSHPM